MKNEKVDIQEKKNEQGQKKEIEVRENDDDNDKGKDIDNKIKENSNKKIEPEGNSEIDEKGIKEENTEKNRKIDIQEQNNRNGFLRSFVLCLFMFVVALLAFSISGWCLMQVKLLIKLFSLPWLIFGTVVLVIAVRKFIRRIGTENKNLTPMNYLGPNSLKILNEQEHQLSVNGIGAHTQIQTPQMKSQEDINKQLS